MATEYTDSRDWRKDGPLTLVVTGGVGTGTKVVAFIPSPYNRVGVQVDVVAGMGVQVHYTLSNAADINADTAIWTQQGTDLTADGVVYVDGPVTAVRLTPIKNGAPADATYTGEYSIVV